MWKIAEVIMLVYLGVGMLFDLKNRSLPVWYLGSGTVVVLFAVLRWQKMSIYEWVLGGIMGGMFLAMGRLTGESIGYGDGWMICNLGIFCGFWELCGILICAFGVSSIFCIWGMRRKKWKKNMRIPFVPFLFLGYLGVTLW